MQQHTEGMVGTIMNFAGNLLLFPAVKELWKSVKNWQSYPHEFGVGLLLFWDTVYLLYVQKICPKLHSTKIGSVGGYWRDCWNIALLCIFYNYAHLFSRLRLSDETGRFSGAISKKTQSNARMPFLDYSIYYVSLYLQKWSLNSVQKLTISAKSLSL